MLQGGSITWPVAAASALSREVGRVDEAIRTKDAAIALVESRMDRPDWPQIEQELSTVIGFEPEEVSAGDLRRAVHGNLGELLWTVLITEVVADQLSKQQRFQGRGAWLTGLGPVGELPGPEWRAPGSSSIGCTPCCDLSAPRRCLRSSPAIWTTTSKTSNGSPARCRAGR